MTPATLDAFDNPFIQAAISERMGGPSIACPLDELGARLGKHAAEHVVSELKPLILRHGGGAGGWLSSADAAEYLGIHPTTLRERAAEGRIDSVQDTPGGPRFYRPADLDASRLGH